MKTQKEARELARNTAIEGMGMLAHALNATGNNKINYKYSDEDLDRFEHLCAEIVEIVERGHIQLVAVPIEEIYEPAYLKFRQRIIAN